MPPKNHKNKKKEQYKTGAEIKLIKHLKTHPTFHKKIFFAHKAFRLKNEEKKLYNWISEKTNKRFSSEHKIKGFAGS